MNRRPFLFLAALGLMAVVAAVAAQKKPAGKLLVLEWAARASGDTPPVAVLIEMGLKDAAPGGLERPRRRERGESRAPRGLSLPRGRQAHRARRRCHNFFAQFGRIARRLDRSASHYLGWVQWSACVILIRSVFVQ